MLNVFLKTHGSNLGHWYEADLDLNKKVYDEAQPWSINGITYFRKIISPNQCAKMAEVIKQYYHKKCMACSLNYWHIHVLNDSIIGYPLWF